MKEVEIWTDGASKGNPGPGGWGAWMKYKGHVLELCGGALSTTNNQMELTAPTEALCRLKEPCKVTLHTDSKYVQQGMTAWIYGWIKKGWKTADGSPVKNADLWKKLYEAAKPHDIEWVWVKGHDGIEGNERADFLANLGVEKTLEQSKKKELKNSCRITLHWKSTVSSGVEHCLHTAGVTGSKPVSCTRSNSRPVHEASGFCFSVENSTI